MACSRVGQPQPVVPPPPQPPMCVRAPAGQGRAGLGRTGGVCVPGATARGYSKATVPPRGRSDGRCAFLRSSRSHVCLSTCGTCPSPSQSRTCLCLVTGTPQTPARRSARCVAQGSSPPPIDPPAPCVSLGSGWLLAGAAPPAPTAPFLPRPATPRVRSARWAPSCPPPSAPPRRAACADPTRTPTQLSPRRVLLAR
jgi:hypothetical protein